MRACTSSNNRTFSIAITAWSAKVVTNAMWLLSNGRTIGRVNTITPIGAPSRKSGTQVPSYIYRPFEPQMYIPGQQNIGDVDGASFERRTRCNRTATWLDRLLFQIFYPFGYFTAARSTTINIALS